jgi:hypothetical protein
MPPQPGDVLVANHSATTEYVVSITPAPPHFCGTHDAATAKGRELAARLHVDAWLTEDLRHVILLASYRSDRDVAPR